jgi:nitroreductase
METYQAIHARHTIRDFDTKPLPAGLTERLIEAGFAAPSNNHMRDWHFVVLADLDQRRALLEKVIHPTDRKGSIAIVNRWGLTDEKQRSVYIEAIPKQFSMLMDAPLLLLPFWLHHTSLLKPKSLSDLNPLVSIWCVVENILIAAASEGIQGVTRIPFTDEGKIVKQELGVPAGYEFPCWMAMGYPAPDAKRMAPIDIDITERIHHDRWSVLHFVFRRIPDIPRRGAAPLRPYRDPHNYPSSVLEV